MTPPPSIDIFGAHGTPRAVVLISHGLNLHPRRMQAICTELQIRGATVVRLTLRGHQATYEHGYNTLTRVSRHAWLEDFRAAQLQVDTLCLGNAAGLGPQSEKTINTIEDSGPRIAAAEDVAPSTDNAKASEDPAEATDTAEQTSLPESPRPARPPHPPSKPIAPGTPQSPPTPPAPGPPQPAPTPPLPAGFLGQSLGALVFADYYLHPEYSGATNSADSVPFKGAFFLTPAIALRPKSQLMRACELLPRRLAIPSASRPQDRLYPKVPAGAYRALFRTHSAVRNQLKRRPLDLPIMITADPRDELVSVSGLQRLIDHGKLPAARLTTRMADPDAQGFRHIAVDEETMGHENWQEFQRLLDEFLDMIAPR